MNYLKKPSGDSWQEQGSLPELIDQKRLFQISFWVIPETLSWWSLTNMLFSYTKLHRIIFLTTLSGFSFRFTIWGFRKSPYDSIIFLFFDSLDYSITYLLVHLPINLSQNWWFLRNFNIFWGQRWRFLVNCKIENSII